MTTLLKNLVLSIVFLSANTLVVLEAHALSKLECKQSQGAWRVYNPNTSLFVGTYGAQNNNRCQEYLATMGSDAICIWNGKNFRPYNVNTGNPIGESGSTNLGRCSEYIRTAKNGIMCVFQADYNGFRVYRIKDGKQIGVSGSDNLERCGEYTQGSSRDLVCIYREKDTFNAYNIHTGEQMGRSNFSAASLERCNEYIKTQKSSHFCHYDGYHKDGSQINHFNIFEVMQNKVWAPFNTYGNSLEQCSKQIVDNEMDSKGNFLDISAHVAQVKDIMVSEFEPFIKELSRPINLYTYFTKSELGVSESKSLPIYDQDIADKLVKWSKSYSMHIPFEQGWLGYGLYGATNPVDSSAYAEGNWMLTEIQYPQGAKFLNLRLDGKVEGYNSHFHFSNSSLDELLRICRIDRSTLNAVKYNFAGKQFNYSIPKNELTRNRICHEAFVLALAELDISFVSYDWHYISEKKVREFDGGCDYNATPAVLMISTKLSNDNLKIFDKHGNDLYKQEYQRIYQLARMRTSKPVASWPQYKDAKAARIDYTEEKGQQFGCQKKFKEDLSIWH